MNILNVIYDTKNRWEAKAFLNGEDVSDDTHLIEITPSAIKLHLFEAPRGLGEDGKPKSKVILIDEIKVN